MEQCASFSLPSTVQFQSSLLPAKTSPPLAPRPPPHHPHHRGGDLPGAISHPDLMSRDGSHPDLRIFSLLLKSVRSRRRVHRALARYELEAHSGILNSLISLYSICNDWAEAERIFMDMGQKRDFGFLEFRDLLLCQ